MSLSVQMAKVLYLQGGEHGKMVDWRVPLQSLFKSAGGTKLQLLVALGSTEKEMRQVGSESLAWLKPPTLVCHLWY